MCQDVTKLCANGQPIAIVKAIHTGPNASKASHDDAAGLEPIICTAHGAQVMLTANFWTKVGLANGAKGTVIAICYKSGQAPHNLPFSVMVQFDSYGSISLIPTEASHFLMEQFLLLPSATLGTHHVSSAHACNCH